MMSDDTGVMSESFAMDVPMDGIKMDPTEEVMDETGTEDNLLEAQLGTIPLHDMTVPPLKMSGMKGSGEKKPHICPVCEKIFVSTKGLAQHQIIHTDKKPFVCVSCGKAFRFKSNLFEHRSVHTGVHPFTCQTCGKSCRLKGNLKKHLKTHIKEGDGDTTWATNLLGPDMNDLINASAGPSVSVADVKTIAPADPNAPPKPKRKSKTPVARKDRGKSPLGGKSFDQPLTQQHPQTFIIVPASNHYGANHFTGGSDLDPFGFAPPANFDQPQAILFSGPQVAEDNFMMKIKVEDIKEEQFNAESRRVVVRTAPQGIDEVLRATDPKQRKWLSELYNTTPLETFFQKARQHIPYEDWVCHVCHLEVANRTDLRVHLESQHLTVLPHLCAVCLKMFKTPAEIEKHQQLHQKVRSFMESKKCRDSPPMPSIKAEL